MNPRLSASGAAHEIVNYCRPAIFGTIFVRPCTGRGNFMTKIQWIVDLYRDKT